jgi:molybdopterin-guanine dinucleotide biosynthesis protein A
MPYLDGETIRGLAGLLGKETVLVPETDSGLEPLHAFYSRDVLPQFEQALQDGRVKIIDLLAAIGARIVPAGEVARLSPGFASFRNVNSPEEYELLGSGE